MSKGLEAFRTIELFFSVENVNTKKPYDWQPIKSLLPKECEIIEKELKDYERYKPLIENIQNGLASTIAFEDLKVLITRSKTLEIIKEKGIDVGFIQLLFLDGGNFVSNANTYNETRCDSDECISQEEFDLLKEVLSYEIHTNE